jgi:hypothetical protein
MKPYPKPDAPGKCFSFSILAVTAINPQINTFGV